VSGAAGHSDAAGDETAVASPVTVDETAVSPTPSAEKPTDKGNPHCPPAGPDCAFMQSHEQLAVNHPFATPCATCRHRLEASPTKDESASPTACGRPFAERGVQAAATSRRQRPDSACLSPVRTHSTWSETIPTYANPPELPRDWLKAQILHLAEAGSRHQSGRGNGRNVFEFLTGRPLGSNESYGDWFRQQLEEQIGDLSDGQLFTLFLWSHSEWQRAQRRDFLLPVNGSGVQFATYQEAVWRGGEGAE
jgi:hypothetical protein